MASAENQQFMCVSCLPPDVVVHEILPRLPAMALVRFKCVCKLWLKTISDPSFAKSHLVFQAPGRINISQGSILHFTNSTHTDFYKMNLFDILGEPAKLGLLPIKSCNGLLLVRRQHDDYDATRHYIVNPITGRYVKLPSVRPFTDCFMHFDSVSNQCTVLGWNANRYHIVSPVYVLVFSECREETGISWKEIKPPHGLIMMWYPPALFNGWYHWIVNQHSNEEWAILALNIESGNFRVMEMPDTTQMVPPDGWNYRLVMANESLYLIQHHCPGKNYCYVIWSLKDHEQQMWTEMYQYRVEYCERCKESCWDNGNSTLFDVKEIIKRGPQYYSDIVHTNSLV